MIEGISSACVPFPSSSPARRLRLPGARIVAVRSPMPARPEKVSGRAAAHLGVVEALAPDLGGGDSGRVHAVRLGGGGGDGGGVLGDPRHLDAGDVVGAHAEQARLVEDLAELAAQVGVGAAQDEGRGPGDGLLRVRGAAEAGHRARPDPLAQVLGWEGAHRRHQALAQHQHRRALAHPRSDRAHRGRQAARGDAEADQVLARELDLRRLLDAEAIGQLDAGQVALVACGSPASPRPAPRCDSRAPPRGRLGPAALPPPCPSCPPRSRPPCAAAAGRRATPTAARSRARCGRRPSWRGRARGSRCGGRSAPCRRGP